MGVWGIASAVAKQPTQLQSLGLALIGSQDGLSIMGDADYRKPLTPAQAIEQLERSNPTVITQILSNDAQITLRDRLLLRAWLRPRSTTEPLQ